MTTMLAPALDDLRQRRAHGPPDAEQVDLEDPLPLLACRSPRTVATCDWAMPALATATSRPPKRSTTSATAAIIAPWSVTSAPIPIARSPIRSAASRAWLGVEVEHRDRGAAQVHLRARSRSRSRARRRSPAPPCR